MIKILNVSTKPITPEMIRAGVSMTPDMAESQFKELFHFSTIPKKPEMFARANELLSIVEDLGFDKILLDPSYFSPTIETVMKLNGITVYYPFYDHVRREFVGLSGTKQSNTLVELIGFVEA